MGQQIANKVEGGKKILAEKKNELWFCVLFMSLPSDLNLFFPYAYVFLWHPGTHFPVLQRMKNVTNYYCCAPSLKCINICISRKPEIRINLEMEI